MRKTGLPDGMARPSTAAARPARARGHATLLPVPPVTIESVDIAEHPRLRGLRTVSRAASSSVPYFRPPPCTGAILAAALA